MAPNTNLQTHVLTFKYLPFIGSALQGIDIGMHPKGAKV
jgi:hypothetical protein